MKMKERLVLHKKEMERVKDEMQKSGTPHRRDLYKYYQRLKKEYNEAIYWLGRTNCNE